MQSESCQLSIVYEVHKRNIKGRGNTRIKYTVDRDWISRIIKFRIVNISCFGNIDEIGLSAYISIINQTAQTRRCLLVRRFVVTTAMSIAISRQNEKYIRADEMCLTLCECVTFLVLRKRYHPFTNKPWPYQ